MSKQIVIIYPARNFSVWTKPPQVIKANVPIKALQLDPFRVAFKRGGEVVILTNGYKVPEWSFKPHPAKSSSA